MLTLLFMALFIVAIVEQVTSTAVCRRAPSGFCHALTVIWVNLHSGYLLGVVLLGCIRLGEGLQRWQNPDAGTLAGLLSVAWLRPPQPASW
jgi:hypothetical protein